MAMRRGFRVALTAVVLIFWVLAGVVGAAFGGCAIMGMCEAPCGAGVAALVPPTQLPPLPLTASLTPHAGEHRPLTFPTVLELPPK